MIDLTGRSLLSLRDFTKEEILYLLDLSDRLKKEKKEGIYKKRLENKNVALIFEKSSTRTRCSFVVACFDEGAHPEYLNRGDIQLGHKETVEDTARVLGRMFDAIEFRGFSQKHCATLAKHSGVPVINGLTDEEHPIQVLADLMTIRERFGTLGGLKLVFVGDGRNNVANALMIGAAKVGLDFVIASPSERFPDRELVEECTNYAKENNSTIRLDDDAGRAVAGADVVYTDVWVSMGEEGKEHERATLLRPYQVNRELMSCAKETAVFLHCLPAVRGYEVTEEVFESAASLVFDEAENRLHTAKAVLVALLGKGNL
ncbi:ornithine carbamoyltransferase, catabolic [Clostridia bacterium]|nr:ornithine carbamoyltransferase, catabolic [Clostridia bacterium]